MKHDLSISWPGRELKTYEIAVFNKKPTSSTLVGFQYGEFIH